MHKFEHFKSKVDHLEFKNQHHGKWMLEQNVFVNSLLIIATLSINHLDMRAGVWPSQCQVARVIITMIKYMLKRKMASIHTKINYNQAKSINVLKCHVSTLGILQPPVSLQGLWKHTLSNKTTPGRNIE